MRADMGLIRLWNKIRGKINSEKKPFWWADDLWRPLGITGIIGITGIMGVTGMLGVVGVTGIVHKGKATKVKVL